MKPIDLTSTEVELIHSWLKQRRLSYVDQSDDFVSANQAYHKRLVHALDHVLNAMCAGPCHVKPNGKRLIQGCMEQFAMDDVRLVLRHLSELTWPAWYTYVREHQTEMVRIERILNLWNKLVKKEDQFRLPSERIAVLDELFSAQVVYASFSELKAYKVAFVCADDTVYRLSLESEKTEVEGPFQYTREDLDAIFMKRLSPMAFCRALRAYGAEHELHAWHHLLLNEMKSIPVEA